MSAKRLPKRLRWRKSMTGKQGNKDFYKGTGGHKWGSHTSKGGYAMLSHRAITYVAPDLAGFSLTPYVAHSTPKVSRPDVSRPAPAVAMEQERV